MFLALAHPVFLVSNPFLKSQIHRGCGQKTAHETCIGQHSIPMCQRCNAILELAEEHGNMSTRAKVMMVVLIYVHLNWSEAGL